jgi:hypothetical protein
MAHSYSTVHCENLPLYDQININVIFENVLYFFYGCTLSRFACISWTVYQQDIIVTDFVDEHGQLVVQVSGKF